MPFAIKTKKEIKIQGSLETLRHLITIRQDTLLAPPHNLLASLWRIMEVEVVHHSQEHVVIFFMHTIVSLDITA